LGYRDSLNQDVIQTRVHNDLSTTSEHNLDLHELDVGDDDPFGDDEDINSDNNSNPNDNPDDDYQPPANPPDDPGPAPSENPPSYHISQENKDFPAPSAPSLEDIEYPNLSAPLIEDKEPSRSENNLDAPSAPPPVNNIPEISVSQYSNEQLDKPNNENLINHKADQTEERVSLEKLAKEQKLVMKDSTVGITAMLRNAAKNNPTNLLNKASIENIDYKAEDKVGSETKQSANNIKQKKVYEKAEQNIQLDEDANNKPRGPGRR
jgi:hypothetical protein